MTTQNITAPELSLKDFSYSAILQLEALLGRSTVRAMRQIDYWLRRSRGGLIHDGLRWIYNKAEEWANQIGISIRTWWVAIRKLREVGIVETACQPGRETLYRINYQRLEIYLIDQGIVPFKETSDRSENCTPPVQKLHTTCAEIAHPTPLQSLQEADYTAPQTITQEYYPEQTNSELFVSEPINRESSSTLQTIASLPTTIRADQEPGSQGNQEQALEEEALAIVREVVPLNETIQRKVLEAIAQLGAGALEQISNAAAVVRENNPRNAGGLFMKAFLSGWRPRRSGNRPRSSRAVAANPSDSQSVQLTSDRTGDDGYYQFIPQSSPFTDHPFPIDTPAPTIPTSPATASQSGGFTGIGNLLSSVLPAKPKKQPEPVDEIRTGFENCQHTETKYFPESGVTVCLHCGERVEEDEADLSNF